MMRARLVVLAGLAAATAAAACTDLPSDPKTPFSTAMRTRTSRVVALGDTLRDSSGVAAPLRAIAFNLDGDSIPGATIRYFAAFGDSVPVTVDAATGYVVAKRARGYAGRRAILLANVGSLQTPPETIRVTLRPDAVLPLDSVVDTIPIRIDDVTHGELRVRVRHLVDPDSGDLATDTVAAGYEVRYSVVQPQVASAADTTLLYWSGLRRSGTFVATADSNGVANASLRIRAGPLLERHPSRGYDTVIVRARIVGKGGVRGSVDFVRVLDVRAPLP